MPLETLMAFAAASIVLAFAPGPDNIFVLTQSAMNGARAGVAVTFGLATGLILHTAAVVLGLAALIQVSPVAFFALKLIGAAYLLYLAWGAFRARPEALGSENAGLSLVQYYRRGIIMNATNPKVTIFFLAFLPQFVDPAAGNATAQMLLLALVFFIVTLVVFSGVALASGWLGQALSRSPKAQTIINRIAGLVFVGLAARLLVTER